MFKIRKESKLKYDPDWIGKTTEDFPSIIGTKALNVEEGTVLQITYTRTGRSISTIIVKNDNKRLMAPFDIIWKDYTDATEENYYGPGTNGYNFVQLPITKERAIALIDAGILPLRNTSIRIE